MPTARNDLLTKLVRQGYIERLEVEEDQGIVITERGMYAAAILWNLLTPEQRATMPMAAFRTLEVTLNPTYTWKEYQRTRKEES